jgi:hypothetical protein
MAITSIKTGSSFTNLVKYNDFLAGNTAFSPSSYESIASATGTGSSATITFSSIPGTYKHLQIRTLAISAASDASVTMTCNGVTSASYAQHQLFGNGSSVFVGGSASQTGIAQLIRSTATYPSVGIIDIIDYASTTKNKTIRSFMGEDANGSGRTGVFSGLFIDTTAITSLTFVASQNFATSTVFALYGIKG